MLPEASLPPSDEHTYAKWLRKDDSSCKELVQPSPYKSAPPPSGQPTAVYCKFCSAKTGIHYVNDAQQSPKLRLGTIDSFRCSQLSFSSYAGHFRTTLTSFVLLCPQPWDLGKFTKWSVLAG